MPCVRSTTSSSRRAPCRAERVATIDAVADRAVANQGRYEAVASKLGTPWYVVAAIHSLEGSQSFNGHLHNGDPLTARTVQFPPGRPSQGQPPFTWEESAEDALRGHRFHEVGTWTVPVLLFKLEEYNGFGYRDFHPEVLSPYLWSFTNHYTRGKFVSDGNFSATAVSQQCGGVALIRRMLDRRAHPGCGRGWHPGSGGRRDTRGGSMAFDTVPSPMFPDNPTVSVRSALKFAMEWSLAGRNAAQAAARDSASGLEIIKALAAAQSNQLTEAEIEAAVERGARKAVEAGDQPG